MYKCVCIYIIYYMEYPHWTIWDEKLARDPILPWGPSVGCVGRGRINRP